jgi:hypothetical protein
VDPEPAVGAAVDATKAVIAGEHVVRGTGGSGAITLLEKLHDCIRTAEDVLAHTKAPEGKVRNSKLMLQAAENPPALHRTGARVAEMLVNAAEVEHAAEWQPQRGQSAPRRRRSADENVMPVVQDKVAVAVPLYGIASLQDTHGESGLGDVSHAVL